MRPFITAQYRMLKPFKCFLREDGLNKILQMCTMEYYKAIKKRIGSLYMAMEWAPKYIVKEKQKTNNMQNIGIESFHFKNVYYT